MARETEKKKSERGKLTGDDEPASARSTAAPSASASLLARHDEPAFSPASTGTKEIAPSPGDSGDWCSRRAGTSRVMRRPRR